jgi:hypothetical protein
MEMILAVGVPLWLENLSVWWMTGIMGICLYFVPLFTCLLVYALKGVKIYFRLRKGRVGEEVDASEKSRWSKFYDPDDLTVGHIIGFTFISVCPVVNLIAFMKECAWEVLKFLCKKFEWLFTAQLVPDSDKYKKIREEKERKAENKRY